MSDDRARIVIKFKGETFGLIFDFSAIVAFEEFDNRSMIECIQILQQAEKGEGSPKLTMLANLVRAGAMRDHGDIGLEKAGSMLGEPSVRAAIGAGIVSALPESDGDAVEEGEEASPFPKAPKDGNGGA
jgi:hypothetical protein